MRPCQTLPGYHMIKEFEVLDFLEESGISTTRFQQAQT